MKAGVGGVFFALGCSFASPVLCDPPAEVMKIVREGEIAGPKWDKDATTPVPAGSFVVHHANQIHYDGAKDDEVVVQIMGVGPSATIRVDESGQPKR